jgi:hypothetical protein
MAAAQSVKEKGLAPGFEATLDAHFEAMVSDESFKVPGVVVLARRGKDTYAYRIIEPPTLLD